MSRWALHSSRTAIDALYHRVDRNDVKAVTAALKALAVDPTPAHMQPSEENPSFYWIAAPGDYIVTYEIVDEQQIVRILTIE